MPGLNKKRERERERLIHEEGTILLHNIMILGSKINTKIIEQYFQSTEIRQPLALNSAKLSFKIWTKSKDFPDKA